MEQKIDKNTKPKIPQQPLTADTYVDEFIEIASQKLPKSAVMEFLKSWRNRAEQGAKVLPFEKMMKPYHLSLAEWFCVGVVGYHNLIGKRFGTSREDLIDKLLQNSICSASQLKDIFSANSTLFARHILEENDGNLILARKFYDKLFGINTTQKPKSKKSTRAPIIKPFPLNLAEQIKKSVIGQDEAVDQLCSVVYEHYLRCQNGQTAGKNNVLLLGPTGTGKTFLCHTLARLLKVPFLDVNITQYTESGYVGADVGDILRGLSRQVPTMLNHTFPFSIVYIDEIDKLRSLEGKEQRDIKGGVQAELLKLLESTHYTSPAKHLESSRTYDISNILFIAGGAFVGLNEIIAKRLNKHGIGFAAEIKKQNATSTLKQVGTDDLIAYGFMPEFLGRMASHVVLNDLDEQSLVRILTEGKNNVISQYKAIFKKAGIRLIVPKEILHTIAREAIANKTGARGLAQVVSAWLNHQLLKTKKAHKKQYTLSVNP